MDGVRGAVSFAMSISVSMASTGRVIAPDRHFLETCPPQGKGEGKGVLAGFLDFVKTRPDEVRECPGPYGVYRCGWSNIHSITSGGTRD
jgi:hypothetical protein